MQRLVEQHHIAVETELQETKLFQTHTKLLIKALMVLLSAALNALSHSNKSEGLCFFTHKVTFAGFTGRNTGQLIRKFVSLLAQTMGPVDNPYFSLPMHKKEIRKTKRQL